MTKEEIENTEEYKALIRVSKTISERSLERYFAKGDIEIIQSSIANKKQLEEENKMLKDKVVNVANIKVNSLYDKANKMINIEKILEENRKQKEILDIFDKYTDIEQDNCDNGDCCESFEYLNVERLQEDLSNEDFKKLKEWKENAED